MLDNDQLIEQFDKQFELLKTRSLSYQKAIAPMATKVAQGSSRNLKRVSKRMRGGRIIV